MGMPDKILAIADDNESRNWWGDLKRAKWSGGFTEYVRKDWMIKKIKQMKKESLNSARTAALDDVLYYLFGEE